ncbi:MFS transporter [Gluconacetobacter tumulisoli]|uniref:MFS transporter n=1 Tax=Gluconacetobacter tumulisoli TaxID=1286189 RepID=A0A7W4K817_9PROT|nr:MFS transporter [Gluconacetobacter tumulisoli]MBB2202084.1 MFS transporter [Gluconacetobacter tumulisoli]
MMERFDTLPLSRFHWRILFAGALGLLTDGYVLGSVSAALPGVQQALRLDAAESGLVAAAPLLGLLLGSLFAGRIIDSFGRRRPFVLDMPVFAVLALGHLFVPGLSVLVGLRFAIGCLLGVDYVATKIYVGEFMPSRMRGRMMSWLSVAWVGGYSGAFVAGVGVLHLGLASPWRVIFASAAIPAALGAVIRHGLPESFLWLIERGRHDAARRVLNDHLGIRHLPGAHAPTAGAGRASDLLRAPHRRPALGMWIFYALHNVPYLVLTAFLPHVLADVGMSDPFMAGVAYDMLLFGGSLLGLCMVDALPRRVLATASLCGEGLCLILVAVLHLPPAGAVTLLALFGLLLTSADSLTYVYPPEAFPTRLRALGIGITVASSRLVAAITTQMFPVVVQRFGTASFLCAMGSVLLLGAGFSYALLPETRFSSLSGRSPAPR